ncbi:hypothetical protein SDC9_87912 [bioreactor metagenome]|uniref:Uncharacterized protein n=1 Tax=bioreactor metagenome TaxID=1076179 RepID=A0A644ZK62_9ZZZZ
MLTDSFPDRIKHITFLFLESDQHLIHHYKAQIINRHPVLLLIELHHFYGHEKTVIEFFRLRTGRWLHHIRKDIAGNRKGLRYISDNLLVVQPVNVYPSDGIRT